MHHIDDLLAAEDLLTQAKVACETGSASPLWRHGPALRFRNPSGTTIELTTGVNTPVPMGSAVAAPQTSPAPICFDHAIVRAVDVNKAYDFAALTMGLKESGRIVAPDGIPVLGFFPLPHPVPLLRRGALAPRRPASHSVYSEGSDGGLRGL